MAFPAKVIKAYNAAYNTMNLVQAKSQDVAARISGEDVSRSFIAVTMLSELRSAKNVLTQAVAVPKLLEYAKAQHGDVSLDITVDINATIAVIDSIFTLLASMFADVNADGTYSEPAYTPTQTAPLKVLLDELALMVD